jgi:pimeloyl-ACP methyl ester carboxylesterase
MVMKVVAAIAVLAAAAVLSLILGLWNPSYDQVVARYQRPASRFVDLDGVRVHYQDEGAGPPLVLVHGSNESLWAWDKVTSRLSGRYRVIRFDRASFGLSRALSDAADLSNTAELARLDKLLAILKIDRTAIGGISSGGQLAYTYASTRPAKVSALIIMSASGIKTPKPSDYAKQPNPVARWVYRYYTPPARMKAMIATVVGKPAFLEDAALIRQYADFNNVRGRQAAVMAHLKAYRDPDKAAILGRITAPVLLVWGDSNPAMKATTANLFQDKLVKAASTQVLIYPGVGHKIEHEEPDRLAADIDRFLTAVNAPPP